MTLLVKNEDDIIKENIDFHLHHGVDYFIITNHNSSDNTLNILSEYQKLNLATIININSDTYEQHLWVSNMAKLAYSKFNNSWIINNDADEFWVPQPPFNNLKSILSLFNNHFKLHVQRFDFIYRSFKNIKFYNALIFRESSSKWTKCCHIATSDASIEIGNHNAFSPSLNHLPSAPIPPNLLKILHFPIRNPLKYIQKILHATPLLLNTPNLPPNSGFHWINLYNKIISNPNINPIDLLNLKSPEQINSELKNGSLVYDNSIESFFSSL